MGDVRQTVDLQVGSEGVREPHVAWKCTQDEVAHLNAVGRDDVTEGVVVVTQELREVMQQHQQDSQCALKKYHIRCKPSGTQTDCTSHTKLYRNETLKHCTIFAHSLTQETKFPNTLTALTRRMIELK